MNILIIGGTRFQGRYLVNKLLEAGHRVTVFHRGKHPVEARSGLVDLIGDRNVLADLAGLANQVFDACIDTCAYFPAQIALLAEFIKTRHYCLISSIYVYVDQDALLQEDAPLSCIPGASYLDLTPNNYGALKALCEQEALKCFGDSCLSIRPSIIIGIGDHTERLLFWMRFIAMHRKRLDITGRNPHVQLVDVRDIAQFTTICIENSRQGKVNVCGDPILLSTLLDVIEAISGHPCERRSLHFDDLPNLGLSRLPYCESGHLARHDTSLSHAWGFTGRALQDSLEEIHANFKQQGFHMHGFHDEEDTALRLFA
jgi:2'-hydroxyisoflavone reductase